MSALMFLLSILFFLVSVQEATLAASSISPGSVLGPHQDSTQQGLEGHVVLRIKLCGGA